MADTKNNRPIETQRFVTTTDPIVHPVPREIHTASQIPVKQKCKIFYLFYDRHEPAFLDVTYL